MAYRIGRDGVWRENYQTVPLEYDSDVEGTWAEFHAKVKAYQEPLSDKLRASRRRGVQAMQRTRRFRHAT